MKRMEKINIIEKIYKKKTKEKKDIYKKLLLSYTPNVFFCACLFSVAYFCTLQKSDAFKTRNDAFKTRSDVSKT